MRLFHPATVLTLALLLVLALQGVLAFQYDLAAREHSPRGVEAGFPLDDAWIHQVYARSLGERLTLEFNPGDPEVGQSSLLWVALLAPLHKISTAFDLPIPRTTRLLGMLLWMALALTTALVLTRLPIPGAGFGGFVAALMIALDPGLAFASASGMEPLLVSLCLMLALFGLVSERYLLCGVAAGLAILARPEALLLAALLVGATLMTPSPGRAARTARVALPAALASLLWVALCLAISGRPFPNTYYVKASALPIQSAIMESLRLLAGLFENSPFYAAYVGYLFLFIGLVALLARVASRLNVLLLLSAPCYLFGVAATRPMPDANAFFWERYLTPVVPFLILIAAAGLAGAGSVLTDLNRKSGNRAGPEPDETGTPDAESSSEEPRVEPELDPQAQPVRLPVAPAPSLVMPDLLLAVVLTILVFVPFVRAPERLAASIERFAQNVSDVDRMNVEAALWLADDSRVVPEVRIATQDAGALRYFTGVERVIDLLGLNDHRLVSAGLAGVPVEEYLDRQPPLVMALLDPDPGALPFRLYAVRRGLREIARFTTDAYSLFGEPIPKALVLLGDLPPR